MYTHKVLSRFISLKWCGCVVAMCFVGASHRLVSDVWVSETRV